ncbi:4-hydroxythreonine-4-phosphate dehydrogenase PdxA [Clostridium estertheticum]|uniref:4-hydroxythreonine-4-phosphate dehydrogenase PdxA n=1 Tax=Clostridium estertheticum TaxID=238834 RepID=UPI00209A6549|nr:4-hydroxythreonine-4-phosphate dehydrogenase PdxA [Clostridium estertheticum]
MNKPIIGITMGDAAGVGPEIIMKTLKYEEIYENCRPIVIGDAKMLIRANEIVKSSLEVNIITDINDALFKYGKVDCIDLNLLPSDLPFGEVSASAGNAAFQYLKKAIEFANEDKIDAICTAPLNKEALHKGGHNYPGHTEILAELTGTKEFAMMLSSPKLKVIHVTTHMGMIDAVKSINKERVYKVICMAADVLKKAGNPNPRIAVCGVNPHAGENGLFGYGEEEREILPAVKRAELEGIIVNGPIPADTVFYRTLKGEFDIVVVMYHDQGHIPVKVLGFANGVNITVGLPKIRTSVDHGTAFDIAGKGIADEQSMIEAMRQAIELAPKNK